LDFNFSINILIYQNHLHIDEIQDLLRMDEINIYFYIHFHTFERRRRQMQRSKLLVLWFICMLMFLPSLSFAETDHADEFPYAGTIENETSIHRGASHDYKIVKMLPKGTKVVVLSQFTNQLQENWLQIHVDGLTGWILKEKVTPLTFVEGAIMYAKNHQVPVHSGALTSYRQVHLLSFGEKVELIDQFINQNYELWYRVKVNEKTGWVHSIYLTSETLPNKLYAKDHNTLVKSGAMDQYRTVAVLTANEEVQIIGVFVNANNEKWYHAQLSNGTQGWVRAESLQEKNTETNVTNHFYVYAKDDNTIIRRGALESYQETARLSKNTKVLVIDEFTNQLNEKWYRVQLANGVTGWVLADQVQENPIKQDDITYVYAKENQTALRRGALSSYRAVALLKRNEKLTVIDQFTNQYDELWYRVQLNNGVSGWVLADDVSAQPLMDEIFYVKVDAANVRSGASTSYKKVATLEKGTAVSAIDNFTNQNGELWYRIKVNDTTYGWISATLLTSEKIEINKTKVIGTKNAYMRRGASFSYSVTQYIPYQTKVTVISEFYNHDRQKWVNVQLSNGKRGWLPSWEVYQSLTDRKYVYSIKNNVLRKGASASYQSNANVKSGEPLLYLWKYGEWINVETNSGIRGWILEKDTKTYIPNLLTGPAISKYSTNGILLTWEKSKNFSLKYSMLSNRAIKITGQNMTAEVPNEKIEGIKEITASTGSLTITPEANYSLTVRSYDNRLTIKVLPIGIKGKKIIIDAGHGGHDAGAIGPTKLYEKEVTLAVAKYLKTELEKQGAIVKLTRSSDIYLTLQERVDISNTSDFDAFISIHANSSTSRSAHGTETYFNTQYNFNGPKSTILAKYVQDALIKELKTYNRGEKTANYYVLKYNNLPSVLVELAFISNPSEESMLRSDLVRRKAAMAIAEGVKNYFNGGY
jgi:N-acetylmuramoyl-L-alanine amidase